MKKLIVGLSLLAVASSAQAGVITVTTGGPLDSYSINTSITNDDGFDLLRVTFDLSGTSMGSSQLVIDGVAGYFGEVAPAGGTAIYFQEDPLGGGYSTFGFDFTSFNHGDTFSFSWDPDVPSSDAFGAIVSQTAGMAVTFVTSGGTVNGVMEIFGDDVTATVASPTSVPEPGSTLLLFGVGLVALKAWRKR